MILPELFGSSRTWDGAHPSDSSLSSLFADSSTDAGIDVDDSNILTSSAVAAAVYLLGMTLGTLPANVHRRDDRSVARSHQSHRLVHVEPNEDQSPVEFFFYMVTCKLIYGNAYAEVVRNRLGIATALCPIHPRRVTPRRNKAGRLYYEVARSQGKPDELPAENMLHIPHFVSSDGVTGLGLLDLARGAVGVAMATERHGARYFRNYARPNGYLKWDRSLQKNRAEAKKRLRAEWLQEQAGDNTHSVAILEDGWGFESLPVNNEEAQFLATRIFQIDEVSRFTLVPPTLLMELSRAHFNNMEELAKFFDTFTLRSHCVAFEKQFDRRVLTRTGQASFYMKFKMPGLLRANTADRHNAYAVGLQNGIYSQNEVRRWEDLPPIEDGDVYRTPMNLAEGPQPTRSASYQSFAAAAIDRIIGREDTLLIDLVRSEGGLEAVEEVFGPSGRHATFVAAVLEPFEAVSCGDFSSAVFADRWCGFVLRQFRASTATDAPLEELERRLSGRQQHLTDTLDRALEGVTT